MRGLVCILFFYTSVVQAGEAERVFEQVRESMVTIITLDERNEQEFYGSGVVAAAGKIITNCHVVRDASAIQVTWKDKKFSAALEWEDSERDLCRLQVQNFNAKPITLRSTKELAPGEAVFAIGNPLGFGLSVSAGIVSAVKEYQGARWVFSSTPLSQGSSGGGLFDAKGRLVAITSAILSRGQNFNISAPAEGITELGSRGRAAVAVAVAESDPDWHAQAENLRKSAQWQKLANWGRQWASAYPAASLADQYLGIALYNLGEKERGRKALLNAMRDPGNVGARVQLAAILYESEERQQANQLFEQAMQIYPYHSDAWFARAEFQLREKEYAAALEPIREVLRREPWNDRAWSMQGTALANLGRLKEAGSAFRTSLRLNPSNELVKTMLAAALAASGDAADARQLLAGTSKEKTRDAFSWANIGLDEEKKKNLGEAERAYRKALELNPKYELAWYRLGHILLASGRSEEAEKAMRTILALKPDAPEVMVDLSEILRARGEKTERKALVEKAYALAPRSPPPAFAMARLREEARDVAGMIEPLRTVTQADPKNAHAWMGLGNALVRTGKHEEGYQALKTAQALDSQQADTLNGLAVYHGLRGEYSDALAFAEQALALSGTNATAWSSKGYSLFKLRRFEEAAKALETAVRLQPDFVNGWVNLGETYLHLGQLGKSIAALEKALTLSPLAVDTKFFLIQALLLSQQAAKAKPHAESIVQALPQNPRGWFLLTGIHMTLNNRSEALSAYDKLKQLSPEGARQFREKTRKTWPAGLVFPE